MARTNVTLLFMAEEYDYNKIIDALWCQNTIMMWEILINWQLFTGTKGINGDCRIIGKRNDDDVTSTPINNRDR